MKPLFDRRTGRRVPAWERPEITGKSLLRFMGYVLAAAGLAVWIGWWLRSQPVSEAAYSAWKSRLPASCGRIIEALLVQPLSQTQMATICKMHYNTVKNAMVILRKNALVEQDGSLYKLRRL